MNDRIEELEKTIEKVSEKNKEKLQNESEDNEKYYFFEAGLREALRILIKT